MDNREFIKSILLQNYNDSIVEDILKGYKSKYTTLRVNTIKANLSEIEEELTKNNINYKTVNWYNDALIILNSNEIDVRKLSIYEEGKIYLQNLSSMLPPLVVQPKEKESILDMAAAPGGKTTELVCLSNNKALITAVEKDKIRSDRLKYNLNKQGASKVTVLVEDASKLDDFFRFDKILLDAPCSGSGTIDLDNYMTYKNFNRELINKSIQRQKSLLNKASKIVKSGGEIIYSTCSILKEENENIISTILNNGEFVIEPIDENLFIDIPKLPVTIKGTVCVCPNELYEGFYIAKIKKLKK